MYQGNTKKVLKYLGFLQTDYGMEFRFQTFDSYKYFCGPINTYSFYNKNGCFTLHSIVQGDEWGWFVSNQFSCNQYELLQNEICQSNYLTKSYIRLSPWLKDLGIVLLNEAKNKGAIFGIKL